MLQHPKLTRVFSCDVSSGRGVRSLKPEMTLPRTIVHFNPDCTWNCTSVENGWIEELAEDSKIRKNK